MSCYLYAKLHISNIMEQNRVHEFITRPLCPASDSPPTSLWYSLNLHLNLFSLKCCLKLTDLLHFVFICILLNLIIYLSVALVLTYKVSLGVQKALTNKMHCYYYWYHSHTFICRPEFSAYWILEKHILVLSYLSQPAFCTWPHLTTIYMEARLPNTYIFILIPKLFSWKKVFLTFIQQWRNCCKASRWYLSYSFVWLLI